MSHGWLVEFTNVMEVVFARPGGHACLRFHLTHEPTADDLREASAIAAQSAVKVHADVTVGHLVERGTHWLTVSTGGRPRLADVELSIGYDPNPPPGLEAYPLRRELIDE